MRLVTLPHRQTSAVETSGWLIGIRGVTMALPEVLEGWDYSTTFELQTSVDIDLRTVFQDCGLAEDAGVALVTTYRGTSTNQLRVGGTVVVDQPGPQDVKFVVEPSIVGGRLLLQRRLLLLHPGQLPADPYSARDKGAILWEEPRSDMATVVLEGNAARFPTDVRDLSKGPVGGRTAPWLLEVDLSDLDAAAGAALRLHLNSAHPRIERLIDGTKDDSTRLLASVLQWDVARRMITAALDNAEFHQRAGGFEPGSIGDVVEGLIATVWPGEAVSTLSSRRAEDAASFEAALQARMDMAQGPP